MQWPYDGPGLALSLQTEICQLVKFFQSSREVVAPTHGTKNNPLETLRKIYSQMPLNQGLRRLHGML